MSEKKIRTWKKWDESTLLFEMEGHLLNQYIDPFECPIFLAKIVGERLAGTC